MKTFTNTHTLLYHTNDSISIPLRYSIIEGTTWFVGKDVAEALGYSKSRNAIAAHVDEEDKTHAPIQGGCSTGVQDTIVINESGLYALILSSKLPSAKEFKHWVTAEVLPSIRKTGGIVKGGENFTLLKINSMLIHGYFLRF